MTKKEFNDFSSFLDARRTEASLDEEKAVPTSLVPLLLAPTERSHAKDAPGKEILKALAFSRPV